MARQYEIALSEIMYELAEKKKRGLPGWVAPAAATAGTIGAGVLGHKYLSPVLLKKAGDSFHKSSAPTISEFTAAQNAGAGAFEALSNKAKGMIEKKNRINKAITYGAPVATGLAGGALLGVPTAMVGRRKREG